MNSILILYPYKTPEGDWVFDDANVGLKAEPFVCGADDIISEVVKENEIPNADKGFKLLFSPTAFPNHDVKLEWRRAESGGNWYYSERLNQNAWLCPALYKYFPAAPPELYAKAEAKRGVS